MLQHGATHPGSRDRACLVRDLVVRLAGPPFSGRPLYHLEEPVPSGVEAPISMTQDTIKEEILVLLQHSKLTRNEIANELQVKEDDIIYPLYKLLRTNVIRTKIKNKQTLFFIK